MNLDEARKTYFLEADELLGEMEHGLLDLEQQEDPREQINSLFRGAHTIKGNSGVFGFEHVGRFTHRVESVLDALRNGHLQVTSALVGELLRARDHMAELVALAAEGRDPDADTLARGEAITAQLEGLAGHSPSAVATAAHVEVDTGSERRWHIEWNIGPDMLGHGLDPLSLLRYLRSNGRIEAPQLIGSFPALSEFNPEKCYQSIRFDYVTSLSAEAVREAFEFFLDESELVISPDEAVAGSAVAEGEAMTEAALKSAMMEIATEGVVERSGVERGTIEAPKDKPRARLSPATAIRVDAAKLDQLINLVGELVIAGATSHLLATQLGNEQLIEANSAMTRLVEDIRDSALNLRMVQIAETFARFQRVVRDTSQELGKEIDLSISGGETELDKTVVEKIGDPLMHLVRNAMDHGIESPDKRQAAGKPRKGTVSLNAFHDSGSIVIQVADDGGGIDPDTLLAKARDAGVVGPTQTPSHQEILRLAFEPGLSTANKVTNLSGRGVGLDVVKRNIEALRGTVDVESEKGNGTRVSIRLPLTLAIIDGFRVGVANSSYVIPLDTVIECIEIEERNEAKRGQAHYINLRGEVLPFLRLRELFQEAESSRERRENIVVVSYAGQKAGLVVDELLGEYQTVIKPLGRLFRGVHGLSGATILGSGDVAVILDVPQLIQTATQAAANSQRHVVAM
ncbi:MAG: chemotaxis protein CheA [Gammaproteobacteria bacterium]|nr:chemotaxis protein CheA [Gammaproteobacteria bacterium]